MKQNQNATSHTLLLHNADSRDLIHLSYAGLEVNAVNATACGATTKETLFNVMYLSTQLLRLSDF